ncbi:hypothetical protein [Streptomyces sudanensis]|uniref:hypothetical protein n=1 Tax=Streptomyces sudanensis TaxID=436397 RepID=UPI0020CC7DE8|nr:hypothetical protein [Streptomyces sudanensis]MCP9956343.1 hypothetical protein [Streptomyces sudanensis]
MRDFGPGEFFGPPYGFPDTTGSPAWPHWPEAPAVPRAELPGYGGPDGLLDPSWDPTEELASLLQDAAEAERSVLPPVHRPPDGVLPPGPEPLAVPVEAPADRSPAPRGAGPGHRGNRRATAGWVPAVSCSIAAVAAVLVSMVSVFGGVIAYDPLRHIAAPRTAAHVVDWWPLLVYGPWLVASLSILRAAVHQRRAVHSWVVVLLFSLTAMLLCVAQAPRTFLDTAAAALPTVASLACFHQLVRLITLTRPPRRPLHGRRVPRGAARIGRPAGLPAGTAHSYRRPLTGDHGP